MGIPYTGPFGGAAPEESVASGPTHITIQRWNDGRSVLIAASYRLNTEDGFVCFESLPYPETSISWSDACDWAKQLSTSYGLSPTIKDSIK